MTPEQARADERKAIVAWLRGKALDTLAGKESATLRATVANVFALIADTIEAEQHRDYRTP